ncbi:MAG: hypothetical protein Q9190_007599, partial [Brigantiaea leucoxantha]
MGANQSIKKAYRKKALELHPDRNYGNVEETTRLFAEVQTAYSVLSDPQERAWYDSHRNTILSGDDAGTGEHYENDFRVTTTEDILSLSRKLTGRIDFSDSSTGFYGTLGTMFDALAEEEELTAQWQGIGSTSYPSFGHSGDDYKSVVQPFYAMWNGFATSKTFSWKDVYRYSEAPDRRVRRLMEKENKRLREEGFREFNDAVRSLVAFARKRDPRLKNQTQSETERQKSLRDATNAQAARSRAANQAQTELNDSLPDWAQIPEAEEDEETSNHVEEAKEEFECAVCRKFFKSEKQYESHEKSKKHLKAVQQIRREMEIEDRSIHANGTLSDRDKEIEESNPGPQFHSSTDNKQFEDEDITPDSPLSEHLSSLSPSDTPQGTTNSPSSPSSSSSSNDEYASRSEVESRIQNMTLTDSSPQTQPAEFESNTRDPPPPPPPPPSTKMGKAKAKRARKAASQTSTSTATT